MTVIFQQELYDAYARNGYRVQRVKGESYKNTVDPADNVARYKEAKKAFEHGWPTKPSVPYHEACSWLAQGGWLTVVLPNELIAIDVDGCQHKVKQIHDLCKAVKCGIHRSRNGHHYFFRTPAQLDMTGAHEKFESAKRSHKGKGEGKEGKELKAWVDFMSRFGLPLTYRPGGRSNIIVEPSDQPNRKWERLLNNDELGELPPLMQPLNWFDAAQVKDALAYQLRYAGINGIIRIDDHITMSFVGWLVRRLNYNEDEVHDMIQRCLGDRYDRSVTATAIQRAKELKVAKAGGDLWGALRDAGMTWVEDALAAGLVKMQADAHPMVRVPADNKLANEQVVRFAKGYADQNKIIFHDGRFYRLDQYIYRIVKDEDIEADVFRWLDERFTPSRLNMATKAIACHTNIRSLAISGDMLLKDGQVFDLATFKVRPRRPDEVFFNQLNVSYDPDAKAPTFERFQREIFPMHPEAIPFMDEFCGYAFTPWTKHELALVLRGEGANGKSVYLKTCEHLLGDHNVSHVKMSQLRDKFTPAQLQNKLLNISSEVGSRDVASDEMLKQLTSGERIQVERKGKDPYEFNPVAKFIFASNNAIVTTDKSFGLSRRLVTIPFVCDFYRDPVLRKKLDPELIDKIKLEANGIFIIWLKALERLVARGRFEVPKCLIEASETEANENNPVHTFATEHLFWSDNPSHAFLPYTTIYEEYKRYCTLNGYKCMNQFNFSVNLKRVIAGNPDSYIGRTHKGRGLLQVWMRPVPYDPETRSLDHSLWDRYCELSTGKTSVTDTSFEKAFAPKPY